MSSDTSESCGARDQDEADKDGNRLDSPPARQSATQRTQHARPQAGERLSLSAFSCTTDKPMMEVDAGSNTWYQAHILQETLNEIRVLFPAATLGARDKQEWVSKHSSRIWRGTLASKRWRYIADGAWAPREPAGKSRSKSRSSARGRARGAARSTDGDSSRDLSPSHSSGRWGLDGRATSLATEGGESEDMPMHAAEPTTQAPANILSMHTSGVCAADRMQGMPAPSEGAELQPMRQVPAPAHQALAQWFFSHWTGLLGRQRLCTDLGSHSCEAGRIPSPPASLRSAADPLPALQQPADLTADEALATKRAKHAHASSHTVYADPTLAVPHANGHAPAQQEALLKPETAAAALPTQTALQEECKLPPATTKASDHPSAPQSALAPAASQAAPDGQSSVASLGGPPSKPACSALPPPTAEARPLTQADKELNARRFTFSHRAASAGPPGGAAQQKIVSVAHAYVPGANGRTLHMGASGARGLPGREPRPKPSSPFPVTSGAKRLF